MSIWDRRLVVVTGKGGVGRTTTSACLALAASALGKRVAIVEIHGTGGVAELFDLPGRSYSPRRIADRVDTFSLTAHEALDDFGIRRLKANMLVRMVFHNKIMESFLDGVPGLHDLLQLGKLHSLVFDRKKGDPEYDLIILDAPATGHGLTLMGAARSMSEMTQVGPFHDEADRIEEDLLANPEVTALMLVTLPEALPVNESLDLINGLGPDRQRLTAVIANQVLDQPLPAEPTWDIVRPVLQAAGKADLDRLVALTDDVLARRERQQRSLARLRVAAPELAGHDLPIAELPALPGPVFAEDLPALADRLIPLFREL